MRREIMVLEALAGSDVPHPGFIAGCTDLDVIGAAFYLMEPIEGFNPTLETSPIHAQNLGTQRELGFAMVDGILALSRVEPRRVGLSALGRPDGWLERQVAAGGISSTVTWSSRATRGAASPQSRRRVGGSRPSGRTPGVGA